MVAGLSLTLAFSVWDPGPQLRLSLIPYCAECVLIHSAGKESGVGTWLSKMVYGKSSMGLKRCHVGTYVAVCLDAVSLPHMATYLSGLACKSFSLLSFFGLYPHSSEDDKPSFVAFVNAVITCSMGS